jgi:sulfoxide reductase catalytic subunit YedY
MLIKRPADIKSSEITDKKLYLNRREFIRTTTGTAVAAAAGMIGAETLVEAKGAPHGRKLQNIKQGGPAADEKLNSWEDITSYNNYYEFGTDKSDPAANAGKFKTEPWTVTIDGECNKKGVWNLEDVLKGETLEERVYRHRCVEAWSMVIPWVGFRANLIKRCEPTSKAKYVEFTTLYDPKQMPASAALCSAVCRGPAMDRRCPLTLMVVRRSVAEPGRRSAPPRRAVEIRLQARQVDREGEVRGKAAAQHLAGAGVERIRLLRERQPAG